jgi:hypothetical protein
MRLFTSLSAAALIATAMAPATMADGRNPGSALVYPIHRSGNNFFSVMCVSNTNTTPAGFGQVGGTINAVYNYVNTIPNPLDPQLPLDCYIVDRVETLSPADTLCVLSRCHNAATAEGYLVIYAGDPLTDDGKTAVEWDYLVGSELVLTALGGVYSINAIPFNSEVAGDKTPTDLDGDEQLDFDGAEYEGIADTLIIDSFVAIAGSSLTLINLSGGTQFTAVAKFDIWNDNEKPLSATKLFRCWFEEPLQNVSSVFSEFYLANNVPNDPDEMDLNCDGVGDLETGWAFINGLTASSPVESIQNPAFLGAITAGPAAGSGGAIDGGRLLWESADKQLNGDFLKFGTDDPEN